MCFPSVSLQNHSVSYPHCFLWYFPCCFLVSLGWSVIFKDTTASWDPGKVLKNLIEFLNSVSVSSKLVIHVSQASKVLPKHYGMTCRNGKRGVPEIARPAQRHQKTRRSVKENNVHLWIWDDFGGMKKNYIDKYDVNVLLWKKNAWDLMRFDTSWQVEINKHGPTKHNIAIIA